MADRESKIESDLDVLHDAYENNNLRLLVGAGASIMAGFPDRTALEFGLLKSFLAKDLETTQKVSSIILPFLDRISREVHEKLQRDALTLAWHGANDAGAKQPGWKDFEIFAKVLYDGRRIDQLPVPSLQRQIACMNKAIIFTTNYDPLIELAMARLSVDDGVHQNTPERQWKQYMKTEKNGGIETYSPSSVYHLHGYVSPEGRKEGSFILTERHYFELAKEKEKNNVANVMLGDALNKDGILLIVGMSLTDPNLRRVLYEATKSDINRPTIYAVLRENDETVRTYQTTVLQYVGINPIWVGEYEQIENVLRQVKHATYHRDVVPAWATASAVWISGKGLSNLFFNTIWQEKAHTVECPA